MKARIIRLIFATHRWVGVVLGLLMLLWCLSGFVLIFSPFPSTTLGNRDYRVEGLAPLSLSGRLAFPDIPAEATLSSARIEMLADKPVIALAWQAGEQSGSGRYDLTTAQKIETIDEATALAVANTYVERHKLSGIPSIKRLGERDEFTVYGYLNAQRPFYETRLNDDEKTLLYISSKTGEISQRTTASLRFWSWLGAIPHWLYFTELRKNGELWTNVIITTSLGGTFLTAIGLFVGIRQFRKRHSTGHLASPYRGAKFWHHMVGLVFGVMVLTWVFSGFTSMQPWGWLESGPEAGQAVDRLTGKPVAWSEAKPAIEAQAAALRSEPRETALISFSRLEGKPSFVWRHADGTRERRAGDGSPMLFDEAARQHAAALLAGPGATPRIELIETDDAYYYKGAAASDFPILRITVPDRQDTRFYLDPASAEVRWVADPGARDFRWWHMALHRLDFLGSPAREIMVVLLLLGVTAVCGFGAWIGIKKIARGGRLDNLAPTRPAEAEPEARTQDAQT